MDVLTAAASRATVVVVVISACSTAALARACWCRSWGRTAVLAPVCSHVDQNAFFFILDKIFSLSLSLSSLSFLKERN